MFETIFFFLVSLFLVLKGATLATKYSFGFAESFRIPRYAVGFIIIALISILPETFIAVSAAVQGFPSLGLGTLLGSNVADLSVIFAIIVFYTGRRIRIESSVLKNIRVYPFLILLPIILGIDGHFSRFEGLALIIAGGAFFYASLRGQADTSPEITKRNRYKLALLLLGSMAMLLIGSHFTVSTATDLALLLGVKPVLIGMLVVGLGTTIPELFFALQSMKEHDDSMAVGDILGTVLADATIVIGILAVVRPFSFPQKIIYVTGFCMLAAAIMLVSFMRSGKSLSRKEALVLLLFWVAFLFVELAVNS